MTNLFITSTGTDIGKTFITQALVHQLRKAERSVNAYKPIISGFNETAIEESDSGKLLKAMQQEITFEHISEISPWRFTAPLSPHIATELEGRNIDIGTLYQWCQEKMTNESITLIEGVGGVMAPLTRDITVLDWMKALSVPAVLVVGSYLGTLSHTLTALAALKSNDIPVAGIIITESPNESMKAEKTCEGLRGLIPQALTVLCAPYTKEGFTALPNLLSLIDERPATK